MAMLQPEYMKEILELIHEGGYTGTRLDRIVQAMVDDQYPEPGQAKELNAKLKYHMDILFDSGHFMPQEPLKKGGYGMIHEDNGGILHIASNRLLLTPSGDELLTELKKPKGLERFKAGLTKAAHIGGTEAVRTAFQHLTSGL